MMIRVTDFTDHLIHFSSSRLLLYVRVALNHVAHMDSLCLLKLQENV